MWSNNDKIYKKRYIFLFDDLLVVCKALQNDKYWLKIFLSLKPSFKIEFNKNSKYEVKDCEFRIICQKNTFSFCGKNNKEATEWYDLIKSKLEGSGKKREKKGFAQVNKKIMFKKYDTKLQLNEQKEEFIKEEITIKDLRMVLFKNMVKSVACGSNHTLLITKDSKIYSMGSGDVGQTGHSSYHSNPFPLLILALKNESITQVAAFANQSAALNRKGHLYMWGDNLPNIKVPYFLPVKIYDNKVFNKIALGNSHFLGITNEKKLLSFGVNKEKCLSFGERESMSIYVRVNSNTGEVYVLPENSFYVDCGNKVESISAGNFISAALHSNNEVISVWGGSSDKFSKKNFLNFSLPGKTFKNIIVRDNFLFASDSENKFYVAQFENLRENALPELKLLPCDDKPSNEANHNAQFSCGKDFSSVLKGKNVFLWGNILPVSSQEENPSPKNFDSLTLLNCFEDFEIKSIHSADNTIYLVTGMESTETLKFSSYNPLLGNTFYFFYYFFEFFYFIFLAVHWGTLDALFEHLIQGKDPTFEKTFIAMFNTITDCETLIQTMKKHFERQQPKSENYLLIGKKMIILLDKIFKRRNYIYDPFGTNQKLKKETEKWIEVLTNENMILHCKLVKVLNEKKEPPELETLLPPKKFNLKEDGHLVLLNKIFSMNPIHFAQQIAILEHKKYSLIQFDEFIGQKWNSKDPTIKSMASNTTRLIDKFNHLCNWGISCILISESIDERNRRYDFFIKSLKFSMSFNNWMGSTWIHSVVTSTQVLKLVNRGLVENKPVHQQGEFVFYFRFIFLFLFLFVF